MKNKVLLLCLGALIVALPSCVRQQSSSNPVNYPGALIAVGKGGGFAGTVREYRLLDSGELFLKEPGTGAFHFVKKKNRRKTQTWFRQLEELGFGQLDYNHPGNVYQYVMLKNGDSESKVVWSGGDKNLPPGVADFYMKFMDEWTSDIKK